MNLQGQKRGLPQSQINNSHYLNGKRSTTSPGIPPLSTSMTHGHFGAVHGIANQEDDRFKPLTALPKSMGGVFSSSISAASTKSNMEEDDNNKLSLGGLFQQMQNNGLGRHQNIHHMKQDEILGTTQMGMANHSANCSEKEKSQFFGLNASSGGSDSKKKRSRVIYCHVCSQYKPRSTRARFQVCQHIACYDCVRLALMIQHKYNVKAHCPFCQIELDWNKVKPFIVLFKPKAEAVTGSNDDKSKIPANSHQQWLGATGNNTAGSHGFAEVTESGVDAFVTGNAGQSESVNNINPQMISNGLIAQAFESNGVSKERILKGFFSCYLQKQMLTKNGSIPQNNGFNEFQNAASTGFSSMLDPYKTNATYNGGGVNSNSLQFAPLRNSGGHNNNHHLLFPALSNSAEKLCGEFLPDVGLPPIGGGEALQSVNYMHSGVTAKEFNPCLYKSNFASSSSTIGKSSNNVVGSHLNLNANSSSKNKNTSNCSSISSSISSSSSNSSSISNSNNNVIIGNGSVGIGSNNGVEYNNCSSYSHHGRVGVGAVSVIGLGMVPPGGSILSTIYDNNRRGFACGLFNPSIPTDGVLVMNNQGQGKSGNNPNIHFELQKQQQHPQFMVDGLGNYSIINHGLCGGGGGSNANSTVNSSNITNVPYDQQKSHQRFPNQNHYQMPSLVYDYNCAGSSTADVRGHPLNYDEVILPSSSSFEGMYNDENVRLGGGSGASETLGFLETAEEKQMPSWMITTPCLNMKDILGDWRNSTMLKSHTDMVICSI